MKSQVELINYILSELELHPMMYIQKYNYSELSSFLGGYVMALDIAFSTQLNLGFTKWLSTKRKKKYSLFWQAYVLLILAEGDEELACTLLLNEYKNYILTLTR